MPVVCIDLQSLAIINRYDGHANQSTWGGPMGDPSAVLHLETDQDPNTVLAVRADDGTVTLVEDPAKVQARTDAQWTSVRAQQKQQLYESDWTCSVIDPPPDILAQRDQWLQYRADLRAVTTQSDPFAIVWPLEPGQEVTEAEPVVEVPEPVQEVTEAEPVVEVPEPVQEVVESVQEVTEAEPVVEVSEPAPEVTEVPAVVEVTEPQ